MQKIIEVSFKLLIMLEIFKICYKLLLIHDEIFEAILKIFCPT